MESLFGVGSIVAFAIGIGLWLYVHKMAPKLTTLLFLIAGTGIGGWLGALIGGAVDTAIGTASGVTASLIGVSAATLVAVASFVAVLEIVIKGLWKKKAKPKRWHPWLALALPTIVVAGSVPALVELMNAFDSITTTIGAGG